MSTRTFWNRYNLGDCIWHCHYMRKLCRKYPDEQFVFECRGEHLPQLRDMVVDEDRIVLRALGPDNTHSPEAIPCWIGYHHKGHPEWSNVTAFLLDWFHHLSRTIGLESPFTRPKDLLCDYPGIIWHAYPDGTSWYDWIDRKVDWLVINSHAMSGQFKNDDVAMGQMIQDLVHRGYKVACTQPCGIPEVFCTRQAGMTITEIAHWSLLARNIITTSTGPMWPTFNIWNHERFDQKTQHRIILSNEYTHDYGESAKIPHFGSVQAAHHYLRDLKVI